MDILLKHQQFRPDGIFGAFFKPDGSQFCVTLEHAYEQPNGSWLPKLLPGTYVCERRKSPHFGVDVFQIMDVPNCTYMEIHPGNFDKDSDGCCCLGQEIAEDGSIEMITHSRKTFDAFMASQTGVNKFNLVVS